jgi:hypothetical protein
VLVGSDYGGRRQVTARECGRASVLVPALAAGFPLRLLLTLPGGTRIRGEHRSAGRRAHLRSGLPRRSNQDVLLYCGRVVIVKPGRLGPARCESNRSIPGEVATLRPRHLRAGGIYRGRKAVIDW